MTMPSMRISWLFTLRCRRSTCLSTAGSCDSESFAFTTLGQVAHHQHQRVARVGQGLLQAAQPPHDTVTTMEVALYLAEKVQEGRHEGVALALRLRHQGLHFHNQFRAAPQEHIMLSLPHFDVDLTHHHDQHVEQHDVGDEQKAGEKDDGHFWPGAISEHVVKAELAKHGLPQREDGAPKILMLVICSGDLGQHLEGSSKGHDVHEEQDSPVAYGEHELEQRMHDWASGLKGKGIEEHLEVVQEEL
eukprot:CAMPEP_0202366820 /NCGR_PEP_ID=MMETSP1126-20121109/17281_1 /ASSEMBLY_ACC=CAM_ASM_000457 /TAXON_ID=3047 /ORGANISM="Dunaliella tertiolecta, Strain CCMP1320" /LENGTH=245 /DNA_ID=CAMNT_0048961951 /DNA_START=197 /DNA_END=930 /DNA_ORIENTATION=-